MTSKSAQGKGGAKAPKATRVTKSSAKPAKRAPAKVASKRLVKASAKASAKAPSRPAPKKAAAKPAPKKAVAKPVAKGPSKPAAKPAARSTAKPHAKASAKSATKSSAKPASRPSEKRPPAKAASAAPRRAATATPSKPLSSPKVKVRVLPAQADKSAARQTAKQVTAKPPLSAHAKPAPGKAVTAPVAKPVPATPTPRPVRTSRLAQLTVPGMAQSVASTAAKSSYLQLPTQAVAAPPVYVAAAKDPKLANNWKRKVLEDLTDADVLAMPDAEYMNQVQISYFKRMLVQLRAEMLSNAGETTEHLREDTVIVPDPADRATIEEEHALELRTRDRERKLLKKVEQSINRIDSGDYGYCDETGEPIGVGRLLARPTANLSLEAQQRRELKQKMFGD